MQSALPMKSPSVLLLITLGLSLSVTGLQAADDPQPRLKYRSKGPVCSCSSGLDEEAIRKAWEARFAQPDDARPVQADGHPETREQQKEKTR